jgi:hypothetical protein
MLIEGPGHQATREYERARALRGSAGTAIPRVDIPIAGHYRVRLIKGGPWLPLHIWQGFPIDPETGEELERGWIWRAQLIDGEVPIWNHWPMCAGSQIPEAEYRWMLATCRHAAAYDPMMPEAAPRSKIDLSTLPIPF